jgi:YD repeat-containing protein
MFSRIPAVVFVIAILPGGFCAGAHAQSNSCVTIAGCAWYSFNSGCIPNLPKTVFACFNSGPWSEQCSAKTPACAPASRCLTCNQASVPVDLATGDTYFTETDIKVPGLGGGLALTRTWNSIPLGSDLGIFGPHWTSNFEESVYASSDGYVYYLRGEGSAWAFGFTGWDGFGNPTYAPAGPANQVATIIQYNQNPNNATWALLLQNGEQRVFDFNSGKLLSVTDRNGNSTSLGYDSSFRLTSVADSAGRHLYFSYGLPFLVTSVASDFGVSLSYSYDTVGRLSQVTEPDNSTISFQYDGPYSNLITAVLDSNNKVLESHTYNSCGQGLTASRALGVDGITLSYPLSCHLGFLAAP